MEKNDTPNAGYASQPSSPYRPVGSDYTPPASSGDNSDRSVQVSEPWGPAQKYLADVMGQGQNLYGKGGEYYDFQTYVPKSNQTNDALNRIEARATDGSPIMASASGGLNNMINADPNANPTNQYMSGIASGGEDLSSAGYDKFQNIGGNSHLDKIWEDTAEDVTGKYGSAFGTGGMFGSTQHKEGLSEGLASARANLYGNQYNTDMNRAMSAEGAKTSIDANNMGRRMGAAGSIQNAYDQGMGRKTNAINMAPTIANNDYFDLQNLANAGGVRESYAQKEIQDRMGRHDYLQNAPWDYLNRYSDIVRGSSGNGGTTTRDDPSYKNSATDWIGAGATVAGLFL